MSVLKAAVGVTINAATPLVHMCVLATAATDWGPIATPVFPASPFPI